MAKDFQRAYRVKGSSAGWASMGASFAGSSKWKEI